MPKKEVVDYLRGNISKGYSISSLRKELLKEGYSAEVIEGAIKDIEGDEENQGFKLLRHYFGSIADFFRRDALDSIFFLISIIFLSYLFVNDTLFLLIFMVMTGLVAVMHHAHHDTIRAIIAYYNGFSISAILLFIFAALYSLAFSSVKLKLTTLAFIYIIPLTLFYTLTSSVMVLYFHERLLKEINYKGVFLFIFKTNILLVVSVLLSAF